MQSAQIHHYIDRKGAEGGVLIRFNFAEKFSEFLALSNFVKRERKRAERAQRAGWHFRPLPAGVWQQLVQGAGAHPPHADRQTFPYIQGDAHTPTGPSGVCADRCTDVGVPHKRRELRRATPSTIRRQWALDRRRNNTRCRSP